MRIFLFCFFLFLLLLIFFGEFSRVIATGLGQLLLDVEDIVSAGFCIFPVSNCVSVFLKKSVFLVIATGLGQLLLKVEDFAAAGSCSTPDHQVEKTHGLVGG